MENENHQAPNLSAGQTEILGQLTELTTKLCEACEGLNAGVVVGAGLNLVMTAAQQLPPGLAREGLANSLRHVAARIEEEIESEGPLQ